MLCKGYTPKSQVISMGIIRVYLLVHPLHNLTSPRRIWNKKKRDFNLNQNGRYKIGLIVLPNVANGQQNKVCQVQLHGKENFNLKKVNNSNTYQFYEIIVDEETHYPLAATKVSRN